MGLGSRIGCKSFESTAPWRSATHKESGDGSDSCFVASRGTRETLRAVTDGVNQWAARQLEHQRAAHVLDSSGYKTPLSRSRARDAQTLDDSNTLITE